MFDGIFDLVAQIGEGIGQMIAIVVDWYSDLVYISTMMHSAILAIPGYFAWLPDLALSIFVTFLSVVVVYKILGRT